MIERGVYCNGEAKTISPEINRWGPKGISSLQKNVQDFFQNKRVFEDSDGFLSVYEINWSGMPHEGDSPLETLAWLFYFECTNATRIRM